MKSARIIDFFFLSLTLFILFGRLVSKLITDKKVVELVVQSRKMVC